MSRRERKAMITRGAPELSLSRQCRLLSISRPHSSLDGQTPAEAYGVGRPMDMMDNPDGLPTSPQAQQPRQDVINRILAA